METLTVECGAVPFHSRRHQFVESHQVHLRRVGLTTTVHLRRVGLCVYYTQLLRIQRRCLVQLLYNSCVEDLCHPFGSRACRQILIEAPPPSPGQVESNRYEHGPGQRPGPHRRQDCSRSTARSGRTACPRWVTTPARQAKIASAPSSEVLCRGMGLDLGPELPHAPK